MALNEGNMELVRAYLGRPYRLVCKMNLIEDAFVSTKHILNHKPRNGIYDVILSVYDYNFGLNEECHFMMIGFPQKAKIKIENKGITLIYDMNNPDYK